MFVVKTLEIGDFQSMKREGMDGGDCLINVGQKAESETLTKMHLKESK